MNGVVFRVFKDSGFVFIRDEEGRSRFAHAREFCPAALFDSVTVGMKVEFTPSDDGPRTKSSNGLRALEVREC